MTKTTNTAKNNQQQISKVLMSQVLSSMKAYAKCCDSRQAMVNSVEYKISTSRAHQSGAIASWRTPNFAFDFEYGKRNNSIRVSYMNSDGMISSVFSERQWLMLTDFIQVKLDKIIDGRLLDIQIQKYKEEDERFQRRVDKAVEAALRRRSIETAKCTKSEQPTTEEW